MLDLAFAESPEERHFADQLVDPATAASMFRASLAASKGELESTRPAGLVRTAAALSTASVGSMAAGFLGYAASKLCTSLTGKLLVGGAVAIAGAVVTNHVAAQLLQPVKVKVTLPGV